MLQKIRKRMKGEKGFTLIELLVVIIIIAILAAIAIPTYLGQRQKAEDAAAKSLVRNAMTVIESAYVDLRTYEPAKMDATVLKAIEPSFTFIALTTGDAATTSTITPGDATATANSVAYSGSATAYSVSTASASGNLFGVVSIKSGTGAGTTFVKKIGTAAVTTGW